MFHSSLDHPVLISNWRLRPPTGAQMKNTLSSLLPAEDLEAMLAAETTRSIAYIRWCLNSDAVVPACLLTAALRLGTRQQARPAYQSINRGERYITPSMRPSS